MKTAFPNKPVFLTVCLKYTFSPPPLLFLGEEPADRQTVQLRQRETTEDPSAHGNYFTQHNTRLDGNGVISLE